MRLSNTLLALTLVLYLGQAYVQAQDTAPLTANDFRSAEVKLTGSPSFREDRAKLCRDALEIVAVDPTTSESEEILHWVLSLNTDSAEAQQAVDILVANHGNSPQSIRRLLNYAHRPTAWTAKMLEGFSEAAKDDDNYWIVIVCDALHQKSLLLLADEIRESVQPESYDLQLGAELRKSLAAKDAAKFEVQVLEALKSVAESHGKERMPGVTVSEFCEGVAFSIQHLRLGKQVAQLKGESEEGTTLELADYREKVVLVSFWATWCGPCFAAIPELRAMKDRAPESRFEILGICVDRDKTNAKKTIDQHRISWPVICDVDGVLHNRWQVLSLPTYYVLGIDKRVLYRGDDSVEAIKVAQKALNEIKD